MRWRRSKCDRISRLVAHLRSPNPLLVETGFPASLLDLFYKNHHRFNTPKSQPNHSNHTNSLVKPDAVAVAPSSDLPSPDPSAVAGTEDGKEAMIGVNLLERWSPSAKVAAVLLLVVALAVGIRRLAFAITISAFLLLVLEYVGLYVPCARARFFLEYVLRRFVFLATVRNLVSDSSPLMLRIEHHLQDSENELDCVQTSDDWGVSASYGEIEVVEAEVEVGYRHLVSIRNVLEEEMSSGGEEDLTGRVTDGLRKKKQKSSSSELKLKIIRTLVPKKLRHSKKDRKNEAKFEDQSTSWSVKEGYSVGKSSRRDDSVSVVSDLDAVTEDRKFQVGLAKVDDLKQGSLCLPSDHPLNHAAQQESDRVIFGSGRIHELVNRNGIHKKLVDPNIHIDARSNSRYVMLVVIVLAGLVGGRLLSFLLAIGYFCILKSIHTLRIKESSTLA